MLDSDVRARAQRSPAAKREPESKLIGEGLAFDDVVVVPRYSDVHPTATDTSAWLTPNIRLQIPITSAAMDTVSESRLCVALAREGGIGFIHKNLSPEDQAEHVRRVKRSESGMITDPVSLAPNASVDDALELMQHYRFSGVPIVEGGKLVGILTNRDLRFVKDTSVPVSTLMTKDNLVTAPQGTTLAEAERLLHRHRIEKLPIVDADFHLVGLITVKDIQKRLDFPNACKDDQGRLRVGAALGVGSDAEERLERLLVAGVDVVAVDSAHGHTANVLDLVKRIKRQRPELQLVAGNVVTAEAVRDLVRAGADAVKVGMGPGSICTTRVVAGIGMPQVTAILECAQAAADSRTPIIADGGIRYSGDVTKALASGAHCVMIGSLFAGTEESPGDIVLFEGRAYKAYRGMGSIGAMQAGSADRYFQARGASKLVAEGVEGRVPYKGTLRDLVYQLVGGLRAGMGYCGVDDIEALRRETRLVRVSAAGLGESHPHDISITQEAPNYQAP
ncbi:MAG TPA: IMP dehydrogenase [Candidatus Krumholzibacteria bacterium]|nr:IMP dehydrogenase [Candidatus Krumholzibacteria bacterium]